MRGHEGQRGTGPRQRAGRTLNAAGLAAGLLAVALVSASPASAGVEVSHAAESGALRDGRLILRGVSSRASYVTDAGRSGTTSVERLHRRVFLPGKPATGMLHIAGSRGRREPVFRLTKPRYDASRRIVSYKAEPLRSPSAAGAIARATALQAPPQFGAASLSILPHPSLGSGSGGRACEVQIENAGSPHSETLNRQSFSKWDTDDWLGGDEPPWQINANRATIVGSVGSLFRGCGNETVWQASTWDGKTATLTVDVSWQWRDSMPTTSCTSTDPSFYQCVRSDNTIIRWILQAP